jgi:hypothetical protein
MTSRASSITSNPPASTPLILTRRCDVMRCVRTLVAQHGFRSHAMMTAWVLFRPSRPASFGPMTAGTVLTAARPAYALSGAMRSIHIVLDILLVKLVESFLCRGVRFGHDQVA